MESEQLGCGEAGSGALRPRLCAQHQAAGATAEPADDHGQHHQEVWHSLPGLSHSWR